MQRSPRTLNVRLLMIILAIILIPGGIFLSENDYFLQQPYFQPNFTRYPDSSPTTNAASPSGGAIYETLRPVILFGQRLGYCKIRIQHGKVVSIKWQPAHKPELETKPASH